MLVGFKVAGVVTAALGSYVGYKSGAFVKNKMNEDVDSVGSKLSNIEIYNLNNYNYI